MSRDKYEGVGVPDESVSVEWLIGRRLARERNRLGWTYRDVVDRCAAMGSFKWDESALRKAERGKRNFRVAELAALCRVYGVGLGDLIRPRAEEPAEFVRFAEPLVTWSPDEVAEALETGGGEPVSDEDLYAAWLRRENWWLLSDFRVHLRRAGVVGENDPDTWWVMGLSFDGRLDLAERREAAADAMAAQWEADGLTVTDKDRVAFRAQATKAMFKELADELRTHRDNPKGGK